MGAFIAVCPLARVRVRACVYDLGGGSGRDVTSASPQLNFPDDAISVLAKQYRKGGDRKGQQALWAAWRPAGMRIGNWSRMEDCNDISPMQKETE